MIIRLLPRLLVKNTISIDGLLFPFSLPRYGFRLATFYDFLDELGLLLPSTRPARRGCQTLSVVSIGGLSLDLRSVCRGQHNEVDAESFPYLIRRSQRLPRAVT